MKIAGEEYDVIDPTAVQASKIIVDMWIVLGKPKDPFSQAGKKVMDLIISVWEDMCPEDRIQWYKDRGLYKSSEKTIQEQVKQKTGRSLASYPYLIFMLMRTVFKGFDPAERKNCMKMVKIWPMFLFANKA